MSEMLSRKKSGFRIAALVCVYSILASGCGDHEEWFFRTLADVDKADESTRSWVPNDLLPGSAGNIRVAGQLSPSKEWCAFEFLASDSQNLKKNVKPIERLPAPVMRVPKPGVKWWPPVLTGKLDTQKISDAGYELYVVERPATSMTTEILLFAVDWRNARAFFYSTTY